MLASLRLSILPTQQISDVLPCHGLVYEIGSGYGVLAAFLARQVTTRTVVGIDFDTTKTARAENEFHERNLSFMQTDALTYRYKRCSGVVFSDFLHHISYGNQEKLVRRITKSLEPSGILVIKEIDARETIRAACSRLWDLLLYPHDRIYYRSSTDWSTLLESCGFQVAIKRLVQWFPGSTTLFICTKKKK